MAGALGITLAVAIASAGPAVATAGRASAAVSLRPQSGTTTPIGPTTGLHYAPNGNFSSSGDYLPGATGFNLADVSSVGQVGELPSGDRALVFLGLCEGADATFTRTVEPFVGDPTVYGFYLMDEPDPTGRYSPLCTAAHLKAEADWIHANDPGAVTFIVLMNLGTPKVPNYMDTYNSANTDIDYFGLDPYPCTKALKGCVDSVIGAAVSAAEAAGITPGQIVPVYQAFGGGGYAQWTLPTATQERALLATWAMLAPTPVFDVAYSWGVQDSDRALVDAKALRAVFLAHNG